MQETARGIYDSARPRVRFVEDALELWQYRSLLIGLVRRDLTVRYKRSVLGFFWVMLNPLAMLLVMTVVFSAVFRFSIEHYAVYLLSALLLWNLFAQSTYQGIHNVVWGGSLTSKIYFPKSVFVLSALGVGVVNLLFALLPLALIMLLTGQPYTWALLFVPVSIGLAALFSLGIGLIVATLSVFFADMIDLYQVGLAIVMYLTPIFYPVSIVPERFAFFMYLNPMYYFVTIFRQPIYDGVLPDPSLIAIATCLALATLVVGWLFFTAKSDEFAYHV